MRKVVVRVFIVLISFKAASLREAVKVRQTRGFYARGHDILFYVDDGRGGFILYTITSRHDYFFTIFTIRAIRKFVWGWGIRKGRRNTRRERSTLRTTKGFTCQLKRNVLQRGNYDMNEGFYIKGTLPTRGARVYRSVMTLRRPVLLGGDKGFRVF